ncbi:hypothetical protein Pan161_54330 [Gimesia algae]|uniref:Uncharacterized protein n=1 Tax=Gimesia algae TaxID=2527971 RepID=A0A517VL51_9PLAN|nr:hypothetical protein Pan161_54330 [Gimesia algae]
MPLPDSRPQIGTDQLQDASVLDPLFQTFHQDVVIHAIKELFQIHDPTLVSEIPELFDGNTVDSRLTFANRLTASCLTHQKKGG